VVRCAGVSRGTYYKYFDTLEQAVTELGQSLAEETLANYRDLFNDKVAPATRAAGGPVLTLARAAMEPRWGLFTASVDYLEQVSRRDSLYPIVAATLLDGRQAGVLHFTAIDAAADMAVGATVAAIKRLAHGEQRNRDYILEITTLCMTGLGMPPVKATKAANNAWTLLCDQGKDFSWWREI